MDIVEYMSAKIDSITDNDVRNAYYMKDLIGNEYYKLTALNKVSLRTSFIKTIESFKLYKNIHLFNRMDEFRKNACYVSLGSVPFYFNTQIMVGNNGNFSPTIIHPKDLDESSYAFLGHEFHHILKYNNLKERKIKDRLLEVIPMFYEIICAEKEQKDVVAKEIIKRRLFLLQMDEEEKDNTIQLQCFNSYYYALALYNKYKTENKKILILRLITRVLNGEISTLELLEMLNLYDDNLDYSVSWELEMIKKYIRN